MDYSLSFDALSLSSWRGYSEFSPFIWIFWKDLDLLTEISELTVHLEKSWIDDSITDIATTREIELLISTEFWEFFFGMLDPLGLRLVGDNTRGDEIPILIR